MPLDVLVVGSLNEDLTIKVERLPLPGETILGTSHSKGPGGKGANQAVAIARLGGRVGMIGQVGEDEAGDNLIQSLEASGVDVSMVRRDSQTATGVAVITVDSVAENTIVVSPGANMRLESMDSLPPAKVVLTQLEIPLPTVLAIAENTDAILCLNPAPAQDLPHDLLSRVDVLLPNRSELGLLAHIPEPRSVEEVVSAANDLDGPKATVVTLGAQGAVVVFDGNSTLIQAPDVIAVDTTGAGDAFCGALAYSLSQGSDLVEAARRGVVAGALATTRFGAQSALPSSIDLETFLEA